MIVDETMTGMGRTGRFLEIEHWDVEPDIIVMGKALGAYCPLAPPFCRKKSLEHLSTLFRAWAELFRSRAWVCGSPCGN